MWGKVAIALPGRGWCGASLLFLLALSRREKVHGSPDMQGVPVMRVSLTSNVELERGACFDDEPQKQSGGLSPPQSHACMI